jgi:outer membrane protein assembly factor BamB
VYALNASSGALLWSTLETQFLSASSPAVANGMVYIGSDNGLAALDAKTGTGLWFYSTAPNDSSPAVANGVVYVGDRDGNIYA